jgi:hypothetical protein
MAMVRCGQVLVDDDVLEGVDTTTVAELLTL